MVQTPLEELCTPNKSQFKWIAKVFIVAGFLRNGRSICIHQKKNKEYSVPKLQPEETHKVPKFVVNTIIGFGLMEKTGIMRIYQTGTNGLVNYSADSGKTFQSSPEFQYQVSDTATKFCVIRDEKGCEKHFKVNTIKKYIQDCELINIDSLNSKKSINIEDYFLRLESLNNKPEPKIYIYNLKEFLSFQANKGLMACLQAIDYIGNPDVNESQIWEFLRTSPLLQIISIQNQNITTIPPLNNWEMLTQLLLSYNWISTLTPSVSEWKNLTKIDLGVNKLTTLPPEVREWKNLTSLELGSNQLSSLPPEAGEWKKLKYLELGSNKLKTLPSVVKEWKSLTQLSLNFNLLITLPAEVGELKSLTTLNLSSNQLTDLPPEIANLKDNLKNLNLQGNNFSQTEKDKVIGWLPNTIITW